MDSKGQAFSVFKLLIAAVVAIALLLILLQVLDSIPGLGNTSPNDAATDAIESQVNSTSIPVIIDDIIFDASKGDSLNARSIARQSKVLSPENVCVQASNFFTERGTFDVKNEGEVVIFEGNGVQRVRLLVICDSASEVDESLGTYDYVGDFDLPAFSDCGNYNEIPSTSKACYVVVIPDSA